jgi:hypothetical protein
MYNDNLDYYEVSDLRDGGPNRDRALVKLWLSVPVNYDTASLLLKGENPYHTDYAYLYDVFWDSIEDWAQDNLEQWLDEADMEQYLKGETR